MKENRFFSRKEPRLTLDIPAEYRLESGVNSDFSPSILKSVAIGSFDLQTETELPLGSEVTIRFNIPAENEPVVVTCSVVRSLQNQEAPHWKSGLKITEMDKNSKAMLSGYIDSQGFYGWYYR